MQNMNLQIKFFQVGCGDAIRISYMGDNNQTYNIFIDGGYIESYLRTLSPEIKQISKINLWIATHIDRDHINGFIAYLRDSNFNHQEVLEKVWFNIPDLVTMTFDSNKAGFKEAFSLKDNLLALKIPIKDNISIEMPIQDIGGAKITVLSPDILSIENLKISGQEELNKYSDPAGSKGDDYSVKIKELSLKSDKKEDEEDITNRSSIAFLFDYKEYKILFLGDAHASIVIQGLKKMNRKLGLPETDRIKVNYVKLAHHGSKCNFSNQLLDMIDCDNFIISANGGGTYNLPNKEVLAKILCHPKRNLDNQVTFVFNHDNFLLRNIFISDKNAETEYNFRCLFPENGQNAFIIPFKY